ncbi:MAG: metallophosphoesterase family protein [Solirubrobacterales bacterium]
MAPRAPIPRAVRLADDADWQCEPSDYAQLTPNPEQPLARFTWLSLRTLWHSRNNVLASLIGDPTENARLAWVTAQRKKLAAEGAPPAVVNDFMLERPDLDRFTFMVMGDTGEGDVSQYAIVPALLSASKGSEFTVIASDVLYPAGDVNEYIAKFFIPYAGYPQPIYAVPGNHDWLDGLAGFMRHFCAADPPARTFAPPPRRQYSRLFMLLHRLLWRRPRALAPDTLAEAKALRGPAQANGPAQPNMYFCIDTPQLRVIGIDTGILGRLDGDQGDWLRRVAAGDKPKLLVSGKPIYSGPQMSPRRILPKSDDDPGGLLWSVLRDPANNFVAMISGDVHHYERHPVKLSDGRTLQCVISGGGGAFMTSTHQIPRVELPDVSEQDWVVFPTRGDSLRGYSVSLLRKFRRVGVKPRGIPADEATAIVAARHGLDLEAELARGEGAQAARVSLRSRLLAGLIFPRLKWFEPSRISEALDWDEPPFFKNFLRLDVAHGLLTISAFGVTGCRRDEDDPVVIDKLEIPL